MGIAISVAHGEMTARRTGRLGGSFGHQSVFRVLRGAIQATQSSGAGMLGEEVRLGFRWLQRGY